MTKTSTMFLGDTTNIDYAYIDNRGMVVGGSARPKFLVTGLVDPLENVVVDFSTVKKQLKALIDDPENGYDHKLLWIEGESLGAYCVDVGKNRVHIVTDYVEFEGPLDSVRVVPLGETVFSWVEQKMQAMGINVKIDGFITNDIDTMPGMSPISEMFTYVHGLKHSTSWGCQNIGHGHLSFLNACIPNKDNQDAANELVKSIADELDGKVFAWSNNVTQGPDTTIINYECSRGDMKMRLFNADVIVMDTETTVENIVEYVMSKYNDRMKAVGIKCIYISEGLSKGAVGYVK